MVVERARSKKGGQYLLTKLRPMEPSSLCWNLSVEMDRWLELRLVTMARRPTSTAVTALALSSYQGRMNLILQTQFASRLQTMELWFLSTKSVMTEALSRVTDALETS